jgi:hypothetical protein
MFRISFVEMSLTCGIFFLVIVIPLLVARYYARIDRRLKDIEKKLDKKQ